MQKHCRNFLLLLALSSLLLSHIAFALPGLQFLWSPEYRKFLFGGGFLNQQIPNQEQFKGLNPTTLTNRLFAPLAGDILQNIKHIVNIDSVGEKLAGIDSMQPNFVSVIDRESLAPIFATSLSQQEFTVSAVDRIMQLIEKDINTVKLKYGSSGTRVYVGRFVKVLAEEVIPSLPAELDIDDLWIHMNARFSPVASLVLPAPVDALLIKRIINETLCNIINLAINHQRSVSSIPSYCTIAQPDLSPLHENEKLNKFEGDSPADLWSILINEQQRLALPKSNGFDGLDLPQESNYPKSSISNL